jgi:hypothetical protein
MQYFHTVPNAIRSGKTNARYINASARLAEMPLYWDQQKPTLQFAQQNKSALQQCQIKSI